VLQTVRKWLSASMPDEPPLSDPQLSEEVPTIESGDNDDFPTPRASQYGANISSSEVATEALTVDEDYFPPPLSLQPATTKSPSQLLSLQSCTHPSTRGGSSTSGLQSKATIAISLPEGVYAQQQDGVSSGGGSASVTTAPSFSDSISIKSLVPTINTGDNDVESMLGEILAETDARYEGGLVEELIDEMEEDSPSEDEEGLSEEELLMRWRVKKKHFFILSAAGKPIYSRHGTESIISSYMGVLQAIISFYADTSDALQSFESATHRFAVTSSGPLYLVAISSLDETPVQLRLQLDALYTQVLSTLTLSQLNKVFSQRYNFDLRRLLGGTEVFLDGLVDSMTCGSPPILLSALECVKIRKTHRERINNILLKSRSANLLYGLIVADGRLVSVIRPKRHSLHPPDLQLLFSMLFNAATFRDGGEHWTPICMPKFNSKGFLHAYIHFFRPEICVVLMSANKDAFFEMREMATDVVSSIESSTLLPHIINAIERYTPTDIFPVHLYDIFSTSQGKTCSIRCPAGGDIIPR